MESNLEEAHGPNPNFVITFTDPDNKVTSILGLDEEKLDLAQSIEDLSEMNKISILTENGFQITLMERALAGIESTDTGDIDSQRLYMLIAFTASSMYMIEDPNTIKSTFHISGRVKMDV